jgi:RNA polymerase sigma-70 factor, ECF subfamily
MPERGEPKPKKIRGPREPGSVQKILPPDEEVFDQWLQAAMPKLHKFARKLTKNEHDADDLLHDTYLRTHELRTEFLGGNERNFLSWTMAIMYYVFLPRVGRPADVEIDRFVSEHAALRTPSLQIPASQDEGFDQEVLRNNIELLPQDLREAFELTITEDVPIEEVAKKLGISSMAVKDRVTQAQEILAKEFGIRLPTKVTVPAPEDGLTREALDKILATLSPKRREIYRLVRDEQLPLEEVATRLSIPFGTVISNLHRARVAIAQAMGVERADFQKSVLRRAFEADPGEFNKFMRTRSELQRLAVRLVVVEGRSKKDVSKMPEFSGEKQLTQTLGNVLAKFRSYRGFR